MVASITLVVERCRTPMRDRAVRCPIWDSLGRFLGQRMQKRFRDLRQNLALSHRVCARGNTSAFDKRQRAKRQNDKTAKTNPPRESSAIPVPCYQHLTQFVGAAIARWKTRVIALLAAAGSLLLREADKSDAR
jgi:hypothetical protein